MTDQKPDTSADGMIERLAKRCGDALYGQWGGFDKHAEAHEDNARWWLNAIADELEGTRPMEKWSGWDSAIATLRAQAQEPATDETS